MQDHYSVLGLCADATPDDVRKAYKRLALQLHPDKNKEDADAEQRFQRMCQAYECLIDPQRRSEYDASRNPPQTQSMFKHFFRFQHSPPDTFVVKVTAREFYAGCTKRIELKMADRCAACSGTGAHCAEDIVECLACMGTGKRMLNPILCVHCTSCGGRGKAFNTHRRCSQCNGSCVVGCVRSFSIEIRPGMLLNNRPHVLPGKGSYDPLHGAFKDLMLRFVLEPFPADINVDTGDLMYTVDLTVGEVMCGYFKEIDLFGVEVITLESRGYTCPTKPIVIQGKGIPKDGRRGDVHVRFTVRWPESDDVQATLTKYKDVFTRIFARAGLH